MPPRLSRRPVLVAALLLLGFLARPPEAVARNIVVIIIDDAGVETFGSYGEHTGTTPPKEHFVTPNIDDLAREGILFRNAWSAPLCSATRATIMTGQYGFRTGVGAAGSNLSPVHATLAQTLPSAYLERAAIGKWHMTQYFPAWYPPDPEDPWGYRPIEAGFTRYQGGPGGLDYEDWGEAVEIAPDAPTVQRQTQYATTYEAQKAIDFLRQPPPEPWFLWLGFHATHTPLHDPPGFTAVPCDELETGTSRQKRCRMLAAMDAELGRFIDELELHDPGLSDTTLFLVADNGTFGEVMPPTNPNFGWKGSIWEGGINVPLIVAGDVVAQAARTSPEIEESAALVHTVDVHATVLELAGVALPPGPSDGVSFAPVLADPAAAPGRSFVYADGQFGSQNPKQHDVAVRDELGYKLIRRACNSSYINPRELYDLRIVAAPGAEGVASLDLESLNAEQQMHYDALSVYLGEVVGADCTPPQPQRRCGLGHEIVPTLLLVFALRQRRAATP